VGRPRKTWKDIEKKNLELLGMDESVARDRRRWRKIIASLLKVKRWKFKQK